MCGWHALAPRGCLGCVPVLLMLAVRQVSNDVGSLCARVFLLLVIQCALQDAGQGSCTVWLTARVLWTGSGDKRAGFAGEVWQVVTCGGRYTPLGCGLWDVAMRQSAWPCIRSAH